MSFDDEWASVHAAKTSVSMRLNRVDDVPSGGKGETADLKVSRGPWTSASGVAQQLHTAVATGLKELGMAHEGLPASLQGFSITAMAKEVRDDWEGRIGDVGKECTRLQGSLGAAGREFGEREADIKREIAKLSPKQG
ncbi:hypothetical protein ACWDZ6_08075 [Streptomyces sp. NPDC002926]